MEIPIPSLSLACFNGIPVPDFTMCHLLGDGVVGGIYPWQAAINFSIQFLKRGHLFRMV